MKVHAFLVLILLAAAAGAQQFDTSVPDAGLLAGAEAMLPSPQPHHASATVSLTLAELEAAALANNAEIRASTRQVAVAETRRGSAGALDDPSFMYRGWGTPLAKPWNLNQTQHMFMFSQTLPGGGKRQLRARSADDEVEVTKAELETKKRDVLVQDMLKAQLALTRLVEHLVMLQQDSDLACARLNTLLGRDPGGPLEVLGAYSPPAK